MLQAIRLTACYDFQWDSRMNCWVFKNWERKLVIRKRTGLLEKSGQVSLISFWDRIVIYTLILEGLLTGSLIVPLEIKDLEGVMFADQEVLSVQLLRFIIGVLD